MKIYTKFGVFALLLALVTSLTGIQTALATVSGSYGYERAENTTQRPNYILTLHYPTKQIMDCTSTPGDGFVNYPIGFEVTMNKHGGIFEWFKPVSFRLALYGDIPGYDSYESNILGLWSSSPVNIDQDGITKSYSWSVSASGVSLSFSQSVKAPAATYTHDEFLPGETKSNLWTYSNGWRKFEYLGFLQMADLPSETVTMEGVMDVQLDNEAACAVLPEGTSMNYAIIATMKWTKYYWGGSSDVIAQPLFIIGDDTPSSTDVNLKVYGGTI